MISSGALRSAAQRSSVNMFVGHGGDVEVQKPRAVLGYRAPPSRLAALAPPVGRDGPYEIVEHGRDRRRCEGAILSLEWINAAGDEPLRRVGLLAGGEEIDTAQGSKSHVTDAPVGGRAIAKHPPPRAVRGDPRRSRTRARSRPTPRSVAAAARRFHDDVAGVVDAEAIVSRAAVQRVGAAASSR